MKDSVRGGGDVSWTALCGAGPAKVVDFSVVGGWVSAVWVTVSGVDVCVEAHGCCITVWSVGIVGRRKSVA